MFAQSTERIIVNRSCKILGLEWVPAYHRFRSASAPMSPPDCSVCIAVIPGSLATSESLAPCRFDQPLPASTYHSIFQLFPLVGLVGSAVRGRYTIRLFVFYFYFLPLLFTSALPSLLVFLAFCSISIDFSALFSVIPLYFCS
jgi:hypothetical protein